MDGKRAKNILTASLSTGVMLLLVLVSILVYQSVLLVKGQNQKKALLEEKQRLEKDISQTEDEIDIWLTEWKITERANELGFVYGEDK